MARETKRSSVLEQGRRAQLSDRDRMIKKKLVGLSDELWAVVAEIQSRNNGKQGSTIEALLWRLGEVRTTAAELGVENPKRPADGRGKWKRDVEE